MNVGLLLPSALVALLALAIPLLLHLVRRSEQVRLEFAALRWLGQRAQPRHRPRFSEWLLLAVRLLLLALLALWLAQPVLHGRADDRPWLVVHPALGTSALPQAQAGEQRRWLAPGFPPVDGPVPAAGVPIASLLRELDDALPAGATVRVMVPEQFDATDAQRATLGRAVRWQPVAGTTAFDSTPPPAVVRLAVHADARHRAALPYLRAAAQALGSGPSATHAPLQLQEVSAPQLPAPSQTHLLWLAAAPLPHAIEDWVRRGGVLVLAQDALAEARDWSAAQVAWRAADGSPIALRQGDGNGAWIRLLVGFTPESMPVLLEPRFPGDLHALLAPTVAARRARAEAFAPVRSTVRATAPPPRPLGAWIALLIALLFVVERWLAASPRRAATQ